MPRPRYRQDVRPIEPDAPPVELFGPEQPKPPGLELMQQGQLQVVRLGPLFEEDRQEGDEPYVLFVCPAYGLKAEAAAQTIQ